MSGAGSEQQDQIAALTRRAEQLEAVVLDQSRDLQEAGQALQAAVEGKGDFLDHVSHELRTPLNAIVGFGELISLDNASGEHREWVSMMLAAARRLVRLLDEVADVSRIEAQTMSLAPEAVPVHALIADAVELVRPLSVARGVHLYAPPPPGFTQYVHADGQRLRQVLLNLLSNAVKYNYPGGNVRVTVAGAARSGQLRVSVADTGRGIAPDDIGRLFRPFERLDAAAAGIEGAGLGLALSRDLVEAMGGAAGVTSVQGGGSVFWIELPVTEPTAVSQLAIERDDVVASRAYAAPKTVLYVEDMVENLRLVEQILARRPSATVIPAMLAGVALELARQYRPDMILLDLHLPDMPGDQILSRLRADPVTQDIPVAVLSADATQHQIDRLTAQGVAAYLTKPIGVRTLLQTVDRLLGGSRAMEAAPADSAAATRIRPGNESGREI